MSDELAKVMRRFEERLVHLETSAQQGLSHWKRFHLHNALNALKTTISPPACISTNRPGGIRQGISRDGTRQGADRRGDHHALRHDRRRSALGERATSCRIAAFDGIREPPAATAVFLSSTGQGDSHEIRQFHRRHHGARRGRRRLRAGVQHDMYPRRMRRNRRPPMTKLWPPTHSPSTVLPTQRPGVLQRTALAHQSNVYSSKWDYYRNYEGIHDGPQCTGP